MTVSGTRRANFEQRHRRVGGVLAALMTAVSIVVAIPTGVGAVTVTVCAAGCDHTTVQAAHDGAVPGDTISIAAGIYTEQVTVTKDLSIIGAGSGATTIDGGGFGPVMSVSPGVTTTVQDLEVSGGVTGGDGAGIRSEGTLTLHRTLITNNEGTSRTGSHGGGVYNTGTLTVTDSVISNNITGAGGGGIFTFGIAAAVTIRNSLITGNTVFESTTDFRGGGGVRSSLSDLTIEDSVVESNNGGFSGGGIQVTGSTVLFAMTRTTVRANVATFGGGVDLRSSANTTITDSAIGPGNAATSSGGGLQVDSTTTLINTTVSGNSANAGGGLEVGGAVTLRSSTVANNTANFGGGINNPSRIGVLENSIVAGNNAATGPDCRGTMFSTGIVLMGSTTDCDVTGVATLIVDDPQLGLLQNNGGATDTHALPVGSPAVDTGQTDLTVDQRGRPRPSGAGDDIGAFELQAANQPPEITGLDNLIVGEGQPVSATPVVTDPESDPFTVVWSGVPLGATTTGDVFNWTPSEADGPGIYTVTVTATQDSDGSLFDEASFKVTVNEVNRPPVLDPIGPQNGTAGTTVEFDVTATDPDLPPNALIFSLDDGAGGSVPAGAAIDAATGHFTWTPAAAGVATFDLVVSDGALSDRETITVDVALGTDSEAPTWTGGTLVVSDHTSTSMILTWSGAGDNVGVISYDVILDGRSVATVPFPTLTHKVGGLAPATLYDITIEASDAAGNRSADGPRIVAATTAGLPVGHITPEPGVETSTEWTEDIPLDLVDAAGRADEIVLVTSTGSTVPIVTTVGLAQPVDIDIDLDGSDDLRATLRVVPVVGTLPRVVLDTQRLGTLGPSDVDVLAIVPFGEHAPPGGGGPPNLVVGFRTTAPDGSPGGFLPELESMTFGTSDVAGIGQSVTLVYATTATSNPLRFIAGSFEGSALDGLVGANIVSALVENPPSQVRVDLTLELSAIGATQVLQGAFEWNSPPTEPRPKVTFSVAENETAALGTPDYKTVLVFDPMPHSETLNVVLDTATGLTVTHNASDTTDFLGVVHERSDGLTYDIGFEDAPVDITVSMSTTDPDLVVDSLGDPLTLVVEASNSGPLFASGAFNHPLRYAYAALTSHGGLVSITPTIDSSGTTLEIDPRQGNADVIFVMADDPNDLRYPAEQTWPAGHPSTWTTSPANLVNVGFVDTPDGTTIAAHVLGVTSLVVDLDAQTLREAITLDLASAGSIDVAATLINGEQTDIRCSADIASGQLTADISLPTSLRWSSGSSTQNVSCNMERGPRRYEFTADSLPATTHVSFDLNSGPRGGMDIVATDRNGADARIFKAQLFMTDTDTGFFGPDLLGSPIKQVGLFGDGVPSTRARWRAGGNDTRISVESTAGDLAVRHLDIVLLTKESTDFEFFVPDRPSEAPPLDVSADGNDALFRLWETSGSSRLHARVVDTRSTVALFDDTKGSITVDMETTEAVTQAFDVHVPARGFFSDSIALSAVCRLHDIAEGDTRFSARIPSQIRIQTPGVSPELECDGNAAQGGSNPYDVDFKVSAHDLPDDVNISNRPGRVSAILSDVVGDITLTVSGNLPGSPQILGQPLQYAAIRLDEAPSTSVTWRDRSGTQSLNVRSTDGAGAAQVVLSTEDNGTAPGGPPSRHEVTLTDRGTDVLGAPRPITLSGAFLDLLAANVQLRDAGQNRLETNLETTVAHDLDIEIRTDFGSRLFSAPDDPKAVDATISIAQLPSLMTIKSDLDQNHRIDASDDIDVVSLHAEIDDSPTIDGAVKMIDLIAEDIPGQLRVDLNRLRFTGSGTTGAIDLVVQDLTPFAVGSLTANRMRVRVEDLPATLRLDALEFSQPEPDDTVSAVGRVRSNADGRIGRLLIELEKSTGGALFSLQDRQINALAVDLSDVPVQWTADVEYNEARRSGDLAISTGGDHLGSLDLRMTSKESDSCGYLSLSDDSADDQYLLTPCAPTAALDLYDEVADPGAAVIDRSPYQRQLDAGYFTPAAMTRLDNLYGRAVELETEQRGIDWGPNAHDSFDTDPVAFADQDHLIAETNNDHQLVALSAHITGFASTTATLAPTGAEITIDRGSAIDEPLFAGILEGQSPIDYPDLPDYLFAGLESGPDIFNISPRSSIAFGSGETVVVTVDEDFDLDTLDVIFSPFNGTVTINGDATYVPDPDFAGNDAFAVEACDTTGTCSSKVINVEVSEEYQPLTIVEIEKQPQSVAIDLDITEQFDGFDDDGTPILKPILQAVGYTASSSPGSVDVYIGPAEVLPVSTTPRRHRFHAPTAPESLAVDLPRGGFFDTIAVDSSEVISIQGIIDNGSRRTAFDFIGEDASWEFDVDGIFADGDSPFGFEAGDFASCDPIFGIPTCLLLFRISPTLQAIGDTTGSTTSGTIATYEAVTTDPTAPPIAEDVEFVPRITVELNDVNTLSGNIEFQLDPACFICPLRPLDIETSLNLTGGPLTFAFWDLGWNLSLPPFPNIVNSPDYLTGNPWEITL